MPTRIRKGMSLMLKCNLTFCGLEVLLGDLQLRPGHFQYEPIVAEPHQAAFIYNVLDLLRLRDEKNEGRNGRLPALEGPGREEGQQAWKPPWTRGINIKKWIKSNVL